MTKPEDEKRDDGVGADIGPLPAVSGCGCQICLPDVGYDAMERNCIETVNKFGWQVMLVSEGDQPREPRFAYTIGLEHRLGHPELVLSGLKPELLHSVLNFVARRVMDGRRLTPGDSLEGVLSWVPVLVEEVNEVGLEETVIWSRWFHRRPVRALQLVWPDTSGRFVWQPGARAVLDDLQPSEWRTPVPRLGAFAPDPEWIFPAPAEKMVVGCKHVVELGAAVCWAQFRNLNGRSEEWAFHCGEPHCGAEDFALTHLSHVVRSTPSLREITDIRPGEYVWRDGPDGQWKRTSKGEYHPLDQYPETG